ncbi:MAG: DUF411 domain-containing protein [Litorimonas sp.]
MRQELMRPEAVTRRFRTAFLAVADDWLLRNQGTLFAAPYSSNNVNASAGRPSRDTVLIDGFAVEGHVPALDKKYLFAQRPVVTDVSGPGMAVLSVNCS